VGAKRLRSSAVLHAALVKKNRSTAHWSVVWLVPATLVTHARSSKNPGMHMVPEKEARACRHAFMTPERPLILGRGLGPLVAWLGLFVLAVSRAIRAVQSRQNVTEAEALARKTCLALGCPTGH
jgi:hypothetical protein